MIIFKVFILFLEAFFVRSDVALDNDQSFNLGGAIIPIFGSLIAFQ